MAVLVGGGLGASARYAVGLALAREPGFPWATLVVNVVGSFAIGVVVVFADEHLRLGAWLRTFLVVGVLGGFTTFSSFSVDTLRLWERGDALQAAGNVLASVGLCLIAVQLGLALARRLG
jgi:CrcB protein